MIHHRERLALGLEARHDRPAVHAQFDDLEGDVAFDRFLLFRHPDLAKSAFADLFEQFVAVQDLGRGFLVGKGGHGRRRSLHGGSGQQAVVGKMFLQQIVHLAAQIDLLVARLTEIRRARLRRGDLQSCKKDLPLSHELNCMVRAQPNRRI